MHIRMLKTVPGSVDGIRVASYEAENDYDLSGTPGAISLAAAFIGSGMAEEVKAETNELPSAEAALIKAMQPEEGIAMAAPENEADKPTETQAQSAPENKAAAPDSTKSRNKGK
jgi:hypothetical protein